MSNELNLGLETLNEEQHKACTSVDGAFRLIAGAGSGKTLTLTKRVAYIVKSKHIDPSRVLSVTFTNKAAAEMRERCAKELSCDESSLNMMTFHSLALAICKEDMPEYMGWKYGVGAGNTPFYIYAEKVVDKLAPKGMVDDNIRDYVKRRLANYISKVKTSDDYVKYYDTTIEADIEPANILEIFQYERQKEANGDARKKAIARRKNLEKAIKEKGNPKLQTKFGESLQDLDNIIERLAHKHDEISLSPTSTWAIKALSFAREAGSLTFDDMINCALYLLKNKPEVRLKWQSRFDYIQVDEFQDTDIRQLNIIKELYERTGNLFVVGDPDQSIYAFRKGVDSSLFNNLGEFIPNLVTIFLKTNYRSTKEIVEASNAVIKLNRNRIQKDLVSSSSQKSQEVEVLSAKDEDEGGLAAKEFDRIKALLLKYKPSEIAILYRNVNSVVTQELIAKLEADNIPLDNQLIKLEFGSDLLQHIKDLFKFKFLFDMGDKRSAEKFFNNFIASTKEEPADYLFMSEVYRELSDVWEDEGEIVDLICSYYMRLKYKDPTSSLNAKKNPALYEECREPLKESIREWKSLSDNEKLMNCSDEKMLESATENHKDGLHIMTYHASKGLEFKVVIVNDMDTGILLDKKSTSDFTILEETARLAYVAMSRAKEKLIVGLVKADSPYAYQIQNLAKWDDNNFKAENATHADNSYKEAYKNLAEVKAYSIKYCDLSKRKSSNPKTGDIVGTLLIIPYEGELYLFKLPLGMARPNNVVTEYRLNNIYRLALELNLAYVGITVNDTDDATWMINHYGNAGFIDSPTVKKYLTALIKNNPRNSDEYCRNLENETTMIYNSIIEGKDTSNALEAEKPIDKNLKQCVPFTYQEFLNINNSLKEDKVGIPIRIAGLSTKKDVCLVEGDGISDSVKISQVVYEITSNIRYYLTNPSILKDWKYWGPEKLSVV